MLNELCVQELCPPFSESVLNYITIIKADFYKKLKQNVQL